MTSESCSVSCRESPPESAEAAARLARPGHYMSSSADEGLVGDDRLTVTFVRLAAISETPYPGRGVHHTAGIASAGRCPEAVRETTAGADLRFLCERDWWPSVHWGRGVLACPAERERPDLARGDRAREWRLLRRMRHIHDRVVLRGRLGAVTAVPASTPRARRGRPRLRLPQFAPTSANPSEPVIGTTPVDLQCCSPRTED